MPTPSIKVTGTAEAGRKFRKLGGRVRELSAAHRAIASRVLPEIAARTKSRSGALAGAWRARATARAASVANRLPYAGVQEFGWPARNIVGAEAVAAVIVGHRAAIVDDYRDAMDDAIRSVDGGPRP